MSQANQVFFDDVALTSNISRKSVRGGVFLAGAQIARVSIQLISLPILSRLISPSEIGLFAMALPIVALGQMFADMGLSTASIQAQSLRQPQASNLFWINSTVGLVLALTIAAFASSIARFYDQPQLVKLIWLMAANLFLITLAIQHDALLRRAMMFLHLGAVQIIAAFAGFAVALLTAWWGWGYWALGSQLIVVSVTTLLGVVAVSRWRPSLPQRQVGTKSLLSFGSGLMGVKIGDFLRLNLDKILLGKFVGEAIVGQYSRASQLLAIPLTQILPPINATVLPMLSRVHGRDVEYRSVFRSFFSLIALFCVPAGIAMTLFGDHFAAILLGPGWDQAGQLFRILAPLAMVQSLTSILTLLMVSQGRTNALFVQSMRNNIAAVIAIAVAAPWGAEAIAYSYCISGVLLRTPSWFYYATVEGPVALKDLIQSLKIPARAGAICCLLLGALRYVDSATSPAWSLLFAGTIVMLVILTEVTLSPAHRRLVTTLIGHLSNRTTTAVSPNSNP